MYHKYAVVGWVDDGQRKAFVIPKARHDPMWSRIHNHLERAWPVVLGSTKIAFSISPWSTNEEFHSDRTTGTRQFGKQCQTTYRSNSKNCNNNNSNTVSLLFYHYLPPVTSVQY